MAVIAVSFGYIPNHPKTWWFEMTVVVGSVCWLGQSSDKVGMVGLRWARSCGCGQLVGRLADLEMP